MRIRPILPFAALCLSAFAAACDSATAPTPLDVDGVQADLVAATAAVSAPATASLGALGPDIDLALAGLGGGLAVLDLPAALLSDPKALVTRTELRTRARNGLGTAAVLPAPALGKTFEFDIATGRYVMGSRTGAPQNGVRFILYAVDPITQDPIEPLVETGYADLTRLAAVPSGATARVEVYAAGSTPLKVLDYAVTVQGTLLTPSALVTGFAKNATDSLSFVLSSALSLLTQRIEIDWRTALPSRGLTSRLQQTITGGQTPQTTLEGLLTSPSGRVGIAGTIVQTTGGTLTVTVNGHTFATIQLDNAEDDSPTILNAAGQPPTPAQQEMLRQILDWFRDAFGLFEDLMDPVETLLDLAF